MKPTEHLARMHGIDLDAAEHKEEGSAFYGMDAEAAHAEDHRQNGTSAHEAGRSG